jgi:hypothetical protein
MFSFVGFDFGINWTLLILEVSNSYLNQVTERLRVLLVEKETNGRKENYEN